MKPLFSPAKTFTSSRVFCFFAVSFSVCTLLYFITSLALLGTNSDFKTFLLSPSHLPPPVTLDHIVFALSSSKSSWPKHKQYIRTWWKPDKRMRGCVFLDSLSPSYAENYNNDTTSFPPLCLSEDTSHFRYTHKHGYRSFIRVARIVSEAVNLNHSRVRWYVFGDGDTVFFPENLVKTLSKYDHEVWYYIGTNSEVSEQNSANSFGMGFWGAGFAVSAPLAKVLTKVLDSCLERYHYLYGGDGRIYSCLAELGVGLTREPGFHEIDTRGNIFGLLAAHPLTPLVSLPHLGEVDPIFPNMTAINSLHHLLSAANVDPERILQQTVCYDRWFSWTISVSWGYAVEVFDHHIYLPDTLRVQDTFGPWRKGTDETSYTFDTRPLHPDPCRRSTVFYLDEVGGEKATKMTTKYKKMLQDNCTFDPKDSPKRLEEVVVFSRKSYLGINQLRAPRRQCCDVLPSSFGPRLELSIRECKEDELIRMHT